MSRILMLTSGGVDSSVALLRLAEEGRHSLEACYLKIWLSDEMAFLGRCPWEEDLAYVRAVCEMVGVPLRVLPLQREYFATVVAYAIDELRAGRTPSPDVICNRAIKFGAVVDLLGDEFELFASGHHARVVMHGGLARLLRGIDPVKDQTYFLCRLDQRQLARSLFPIGGMTKAEVRAEARRAGLPNQDRPDSQGICFLGRVPYDDFVEFELGTREGEIRRARQRAGAGPPPRLLVPHHRPAPRPRARRRPVVRGRQGPGAQPGHRGPRRPARGAPANQVPDCGPELDRRAARRAAGSRSASATASACCPAPPRSAATARSRSRSTRAIRASPLASSQPSTTARSVSAAVRSASRRDRNLTAWSKPCAQLIRSIECITTSSFPGGPLRGADRCLGETVIRDR